MIFMVRSSQACFMYTRALINGGFVHHFGSQPFARSKRPHVRVAYILCAPGSFVGYGVAIYNLHIGSSELLQIIQPCDRALSYTTHALLHIS